MNSLKKQSCWEIMQCDDKMLCPVRQNGQKCWEWMVQNNQFQCQYGLCEECIVTKCYEFLAIVPSECT